MHSTTYESIYINKEGLMLIHVDIEPTEFDSQLDETDEQLRIQRKKEIQLFFEQILSIGSRGIHRLHIKPKLTRWVLRNLALHKSEIELIKSLAKKSARFGARIHTLPCLLTINYHRKEFIKRTGTCWNVGHLNFVNGTGLSDVQLLVENERYDGEFYNLIFQLLAEKNDVGILNFTPRHGGGIDEMKKLLPHQMSRGDTVLCICDRDTDFPSKDEKNPVIKAFQKKVTDDFFGFAITTPCREAENFLTLEMFKLMYPQAETSKLEELIENQNCNIKGDCLWLYFDTKNGMDPQKAIENCQIIEMKDWLQDKYEIDRNFVKFAKFGDNPLKVFLSNKEAQQEFVKFTDSDYWKLHFQEWVEPILWFLCGELPFRPK